MGESIEDDEGIFTLARLDNVLLPLKLTTLLLESGWLMGAAVL